MRVISILARRNREKNMGDCYVWKGFLFFTCGNWTQGLVHARQVLYQVSQASEWRFYGQYWNKYLLNSGSLYSLGWNSVLWAGLSAEETGRCSLAAAREGRGKIPHHRAASSAVCCRWILSGVTSSVFSDTSLVIWNWLSWEISITKISKYYKSRLLLFTIFWDGLAL
jgi:hypothetical protein